MIISGSGVLLELKNTLEKTKNTKFPRIDRLGFYFSFIHYFVTLKLILTVRFKT